MPAFIAFIYPNGGGGSVLLRQAIITWLSAASLLEKGRRGDQEL